MSGQGVVERREVEAVRVGDRLVGDLAVEHVDALRERRIGRDAPRSPWSAIASTYGSVAFVSAIVAVTGTPPGMFVTQ